MRESHFSYKCKWITEIREGEWKSEKYKWIVDVHVTVQCSWPNAMWNDDVLFFESSKCIKNIKCCNAVHRWSATEAWSIEPGRSRFIFVALNENDSNTSETTTSSSRDTTKFRICLEPLTSLPKINFISLIRVYEQWMEWCRVRL